MKKEDKLIETAMAFSKDILGHAAPCVIKFKKNYRKIFSWQERFLLKRRISKSVRKAIFFQFVFLFYYVTDKFSFGVLEANDRTSLISILWLELFESPFIKNQLGGISEYRNALKDSYSEFIERYRSCDALYRENGKELKNTLLFEFSKGITELTDRPNDIRVVMLSYSVASESIMQLKIMERLKEIQ